MVNPMDAPWTANRKLCFLLYSIFMLASDWACGESLARTLKASRVLCYVLAFAGLATASFCLGLVKKSLGRGYVPGRPIKLFFGAVGFVILWFSILMANTNNIYYTMTINGLRQQELRNVKNQLELVEDKGVAGFNAAKTKFNGFVEAEVRNMKDEIENPNNPGYGERTAKIVNRIEEKLGQGIEMPSNPPRDFSGRRQYAELMASKIRDVAKKRLLAIDEKIGQLSTFLRKEDYQITEKRLERLIGDFNASSEAELTQALRDSYSLYKKAQEYVDQLLSEPFIRENTVLSIDRLPEVPISIESEDIGYSWGELFKGGNVNRPRFLWAAFIALILDLACFLFWYFGVLQEEDNA